MNTTDIVAAPNPATSHLYSALAQDQPPVGFIQPATRDAILYLGQDSASNAGDGYRSRAFLRTAFLAGPAAYT